MKKSFLFGFLFSFSGLIGQYQQSFDSWAMKNQGVWSVTDGTGTYNAEGTYVNFGFSKSPNQKLGFNDAGDKITFPSVNNPAEIRFWTRLSSNIPSTLEVQFLEGSNWKTAQTFNITSTSYTERSAIISAASGSLVPIRFVLTQFGASVFFDSFVATPTVLLPVTFKDYSTLQENGKIRVAWSTIEEVDNDYFIIQHSRNGKDFRDIGKVDGVGFSSELQNYSFIDEEPFLGKNYYRIKQVNFDRTFFLSEIMEENIIPEHSAMTVFPTLANSEIQIAFRNTIVGESTLKILDLNGKVVKIEKVEEGFDLWNVFVGNLFQGMYYVIFENTRTVYRGNFIKF
ncbi:MAG: hypothetical protein RJA52_476 [Bacteroidota bacterium]